VKTFSVRGKSNDMKRETNEFILMLVMIACILACACACDMRILDRRDSSDTTESAKSTEQTIPTPTPTPTPSSFDLPIEEPQDIPLFEEGYYAVLQGEGAYYNVFDCYGNPVGNFLYYASEIYRPIGIMSEKQLTSLYRFNEKDVETVFPLTDKYGYSTLHSSVNGFYQVDENKGQVALYNTEGQHILTLKYPWDAGNNHIYINVTCYGDETVVSLSTIDSSTKTRPIAIYFVALDGTINDACTCENLPNERATGILGRKYFFVESLYGGAVCNLYDMDGNIVVKNVSDDNWHFQYVSYGSDFNILDYYTKDGQTFDTSLQLVDRNTVEADGDLIYGLEYDVEGITCIAKYRRGGYLMEGYGVDREVVAVGTSGDQMAIKTTEEEYVFTCNDMQFYGINNHVVVLSNQVISLDTGAVLYTIDSQYFEVANEYIYTYYFGYDENGLESHSYSIIDKDGKVSYSTQKAFIQDTKGENIMLYRGPYFGIANLQGEWLIKSLYSELKRDAKYVSEY
jgi:hypothetical protein